MFGRVLVGAALALALAACAPAVNPVAGPRQSTPGDAASVGAQASGSGAAQPSSPPLKSPAAMSFRDFHARRLDLIGHQITTRGRVLFKLTCPPPGNGNSPPCTASAYLADPQARDLSDTAVALLRNDAGIGCQAYTAANLTCAGLRHDALYQVTAIPANSFGQIALKVLDISLE